VALLACAFAVVLLPATAPRVGDSDRATHAFNLGWALESGGRLEAALAEYERAAALDPANGRAAFQRANTLQRMGRLGEAVAAYEALAAARPDLAVDVYTNLGVALAREQRPAEAERCYREALRRSPGHAPARVNLGALYLEQGRFAEAAESFEAAVGSLPSNRGPVLANLALARLGAGDEAGAAAALRQALAAAPNDPWVREVARRLRETDLPPGETDSPPGEAGPRR
jgi:tetratricopeptide (TPR) repeat protein